MPYDDELADCVRTVLGPRRDVEEKKMFGGLSFMVGGKMAIGVLNDELVVRVVPEQQAEALARTGARPMDFTGRAMKGFVYVAPDGHRDDGALGEWVRLALDGASAAAKRR